MCVELAVLDWWRIKTKSTTPHYNAVPVLTNTKKKALLYSTIMNGAIYPQHLVLTTAS